MSLTDASNLMEFIPKYLSENDRALLSDNLKKFQNASYYTSFPLDLYLQGDGWSPLPIFSLKTKEVAYVKAICFSNSCDLAQKSDFPSKLVFAPIILVDRYLDLLKKFGATEDKIKSFYRDLKAQMLSNLFYLPANGSLSKECLVNLSDVYSIDATEFFDENNTAKKLEFRLSQVAHYLFLLKLSVHFCRFWENVKRD